MRKSVHRETLSRLGPSRAGRRVKAVLLTPARSEPYQLYTQLVSNQTCDRPIRRPALASSHPQKLPVFGVGSRADLASLQSCLQARFQVLSRDGSEQCFAAINKADVAAGKESIYGRRKEEEREEEKEEREGNLDGTGVLSTREGW